MSSTSSDMAPGKPRRLEARPSFGASDDGDERAQAHDSIPPGEPLSWEELG